MSYLPGAICAVLRFQDEENHYLFAMNNDGAGYRRLEKVMGGNKTILWESDFGYERGRTYEVALCATGSTLRGYIDGVPMFVVEDGDDRPIQGRIGLYAGHVDAIERDVRFSQVHVYPPDVAFNDWVFDEPFDIDVPGRWTFVPEGDQEGPYALAGDETWMDYRLLVRFRSDDADTIGAMVRYKDADNYYRFSMDQQRHYRRLIKKIAGEITVLWEDNVDYTVGREYILTMDCMGERITGYLDGVQMFSMEDNDLAHGRIGLYWENEGARFLDVKVAEPQWASYHTFVQEEPLPAGTRMRVFSGNQQNAPEGEPGMVQRFMAQVNESGRIHFPEDGVDLRIVEPGSKVDHMRPFLPDHAYGEPLENLRILRKADGTGFFLLPPDGDPGFPAGQYRLKWTYRRNNRDVNPDSQVLRQANNSDDEVVTIDVP